MVKLRFEEREVIGSSPFETQSKQLGWAVTPMVLSALPLCTPRLALSQTASLRQHRPLPRRPGSCNEQSGYTLFFSMDTHSFYNFQVSVYYFFNLPEKR